MRRFRPTLTAAAPEGWLARESIQLSNGAGASVVATVDFVPPDTTPELLAQEYSEIMSRGLPGFVDVDLASITLASGAPGLLRRFRWTPEEGGPVTQLQLYAVEEGRGVVATAAAPADSFSELEPMLHELLRSLELPRAWALRSIGRWEETPRHAIYQTLVRGEHVAGTDPGVADGGEGGSAEWADARRAWVETCKDHGD